MPNYIFENILKLKNYLNSKSSYFRIAYKKIDDMRESLDRAYKKDD